jgi:hypothetical protein
MDPSDGHLSRTGGATYEPSDLRGHQTIDEFLEVYRRERWPSVFESVQAHPTSREIARSVGEVNDRRQLLAGQFRRIQSQTPESGLASRRVSVEDSDLCPIPG